MAARDPREDYPVEHFWYKLSEIIKKSDDKHRAAKKKLDARRRDRS
jgi:hypothetical protein